MQSRIDSDFAWSQKRQNMVKSFYAILLYNNYKVNFEICHCASMTHGLWVGRKIPCMLMVPQIQTRGQHWLASIRQRHVAEIVQTLKTDSQAFSVLVQLGTKMQQSHMHHKFQAMKDPEKKSSVPKLSSFHTKFNLCWESLNLVEFKSKI